MDTDEKKVELSVGVPGQSKVELSVASAPIAQPAPAETPLISMDDFSKVVLKTALIKNARAHPKADKLLILDLEVGAKAKQIVAGIRQHYTPESLLGKTIIIVDNLEPAKLRGEDSFGMLLAVKSPELGVLRLLTVDGPIQSGIQAG